MSLSEYQVNLLVAITDAAAALSSVVSLSAPDAPTQYARSPKQLLELIHLRAEKALTHLRQLDRSPGLPDPS